MLIHTRVAALILGAIGLAGMAQANTIDLSGTGSFTLSHGQELRIQFSVWNYGWNNPGVSPYPTSIGLQVLSANPSGVEASTQGAGTQYLQDFLLQGTLESIDGSVAVPLVSPAAALIGLGSGSLVVTPATIYGSSAGSGAAMVDAYAALTLDLSEQIFGPNVTSRQSSAVMVLQNMGSDIVIGVDGLALRNAISEPSITGAGNVQTSGITGRVTLVNLPTLVDVPEPATIMLSLLALTGLGVVVWRHKRSRAI